MPFDEDEIGQPRGAFGGAVRHAASGGEISGFGKSRRRGHWPSKMPITATPRMTSSEAMRPAVDRASATVTRFGGLGLELDVVLQPHPLDHVELLLERVDMLFLVRQDAREQVAADVSRARFRHAPPRRAASRPPRPRARGRRGESPRRSRRCASRPSAWKLGRPSRNRMRSDNSSACFISSIDSWRSKSARRAMPQWSSRR